MQALVQDKALARALKKLTALKDLPPVTHKQEDLSDLNSKVADFNAKKAAHIILCTEELHQLTELETHTQTFAARTSLMNNLEGNTDLAARVAELSQLADFPALVSAVALPDNLAQVAQLNQAIHKSNQQQHDLVATSTALLSAFLTDNY